MNLRQRIESSVPAVPRVAGHWSWIAARAEQVVGALNAAGETVGEVWVQLHPQTVAAVVSDLLDAGSDVIVNPLPSVEACATVQICGADVVLYVIADEALDATSFMLSVGDASTDAEIAAAGVLGFVYPNPISSEVVRTRWVLQHDDGTPGAVADSTSNLL